MSTDPVRTDLVAQLEKLTGSETVTWLRDALRGLKPLPLISADEPLYLGVLRLKPALSKQTRGDLEAACVQLMSAVLQDGGVEDDYLNSLLQLVVHFRLTELAPMLAQLVQQERHALTPEGKHRVLGTLVDLGVPQTEDFWERILQQSPAQHGAVVVAGLLVVRWRAAVEILVKLQSDQQLSNAVTIVLELRAIHLPIFERAEFIREIKRVLPRCPDGLQETIKEWLTEIGESTSSREAIGVSFTEKRPAPLANILRQRQPEIMQQPSATSSRIGSAPTLLN